MPGFVAGGVLSPGQPAKKKESWLPGALPAIVTGVTTLGGALLGNSANKRGIQSQERANQQAYQLEQQKMAEDRRRYDAQQAAYAQWYKQQMDIRRQIAKRYGVDIPEYGAAGATGKVSGAPVGGTPGFGAGGGTGATPQGFALTLGNLMGKQPSNIGESQPAGPVAGAIPGPQVQGGPVGMAPSGMTQAQPTGATLGDMLGPNWSDWRNTTYG